MSDFEKIELVKHFNNSITNTDINKLAEYLTEDHTFIDTANTVVKGKEKMKGVWIRFFKNFPDYRNHFEKFEVKKDLVLITGYATCSEKLLDGRFIWAAKIKEGLIAEWRVYDDIPKNRTKLNIKNIQ